MADGDIKGVNFDNQVDIEALISAPLVAASKANVIMLTGQTRFLLEYCFEKEEDKDIYKPIMINMTLSQGMLTDVVDESDPTKTKKVIKEQKLTFAVPLLSLVPINSMGISNVKVDFEMEITSANVWDSVPTNNSDNKITQKQVALKGKIKNDTRSDSYKSTMSSKMTVNIDAGPLPLPLGVLSIMELYSKSIQPLPIRDENEDDEKKKN
jgi:hypothetical protein